MSFKIVKGWVPKSINAKDIFWWDTYNNNDFETLTEEGVIVRIKGKKSDWQEDEWPPKKVEIIVVVHD